MDYPYGCGISCGQHLTPSWDQNSFFFRSVNCSAWPHRDRLHGSQFSFPFTDVYRASNACLAYPVNSSSDYIYQIECCEGVPCDMLHLGTRGHIRTEEVAKHAVERYNNVHFSFFEFELLFQVHQFCTICSKCIHSIFCLL